MKPDPKVACALGTAGMSASRVMGASGVARRHPSVAPRQPEASRSLPAVPDRGRAVRRQARQRVGGGKRGRSGPGGGAVGRDPGGKGRAVASTRVESVRWLRSWRPSRKRGSFVKPVSLSPVQSQVEHTPIRCRHAFRPRKWPPRRRRDPAPSMPRPAGGPVPQGASGGTFHRQGPGSAGCRRAAVRPPAAGVPRGCGGKIYALTGATAIGRGF